MFYSLTGILSHREENFAVIDCGGVGYRCYISNATASDLPSLGEKAKLFTHLVVREDAINLFGFSTTGELSCFKLLISVSGVGVKMALALLSSLTAQQIATAIVTDDSKTLTVAPGVGVKLAKRIILELKDKLKKSAGVSAQKTVSVGADSTSNPIKAMSALEVLGYNKSEIVPVLNKFDTNLDVETLIRLSLKELSGGI